MEVVSSSSASVGVAVEVQAEEGGELRKGPWTADEDLLLVNYIAVHGDGRWNSLARSAGLKRSGKSCRLRWLNYLRPNVRRGNFTPEEQLLILELHSRWGNRWSRIAQHLPGRTDNEIKNYWRTRVQKLAKQLKCDVNSHQFRDAVRYLWMPRLMERIQANSAISAAHSAAAYSTAASVTVSSATVANTFVVPADMTTEPVHDMASSDADVNHIRDHWSSGAGSLSDSSSGTCSSSSPASSDRTDCYVAQGSRSSDYADEFPTVDQILSSAGGCSEFPLSPCGYLQQGFPDFEQSGWAAENLWAADDIWSLTAAL